MTREEFFTKPRINEKMHEPPLRDPTKRGTPEEDHRDGLKLRRDEHGAALYENGELVASIGQLRDLVVRADQRGRGLGADLIVAFVERNPSHEPKHLPVRTAAGAAAYQKAWVRLNPAE